MKKPTKKAKQKWFNKNIYSFRVCYDAGHIDYSSLKNYVSFYTYGVKGEINKKLFDKYGSKPSELFWWAKENKGKHLGGYWALKLSLSYTLKTKETIGFEKSLL